jgi:glutamyl/glutaminyl-tRNA synthetase
LENTALRIITKDQLYSVATLDPFSSECHQNPSEQCGDYVILDKDNNFSYQFAVVCDDISEKIDTVIRGVDILDSTARQVALYEHLDAPKIPLFFHHPLIHDDCGKKLSKRFLSESIRELLAKGSSPQQIREQAWSLIS